MESMAKAGAARAATGTDAAAPLAKVLATVKETKRVSKQYQTQNADTVS